MQFSLGTETQSFRARSNLFEKCFGKIIFPFSTTWRLTMKQYFFSFSKISANVSSSDHLVPISIISPPGSIKLIMLAGKRLVFSLLGRLGVPKAGQIVQDDQVVVAARLARLRPTRVTIPLGSLRGLVRWRMMMSSWFHFALTKSPNMYFNWLVSRWPLISIKNRRLMSHTWLAIKIRMFGFLHIWPDRVGYRHEGTFQMASGSSIAFFLAG